MVNGLLHAGDITVGKPIYMRSLARVCMHFTICKTTRTGIVRRRCSVVKPAVRAASTLKDFRIILQLLHGARGCSLLHTHVSAGGELVCAHMRASLATPTLPHVIPPCLLHGTFTFLLDIRTPSMQQLYFVHITCKISDTSCRARLAKPVLHRDRLSSRANDAEDVIIATDNVRARRCRIVVAFLNRRPSRCNEKAVMFGSRQEKFDPQQRF